jgi:outer membrane protein assembly factor BamB/orotate phosphoribosyltransferase
MNDAKELTKEIIERRVFLNYKENIDSKEGDWIMDFRSVCLDENFLELFVRGFFETFSDIDNFQICGIETASIPLLTAIIINSKKYRKNVTGFYIRKSRKKHDLCKLIEGNFDPSKVTIVVDDILNKGNSLLKIIKVLEDEKIKVTYVYTILRYRDIDSYTAITDRGIKIKNLLELNDFKNSLTICNVTNKTPLKELPYDFRWKFTTKGYKNLGMVVPKSAPIIYNGKIYFGTDSGIFYCLDKNTGKSVWQYKILFGGGGKRIFSSPVVHNNIVYFGAYDGNFYALHSETGKIVWIYHDADWIGSSPCVSARNDYVYVGLEYGLFSKRGGVVCLTANDGKEVWKDYHNGLTHCSPFCSDKNNLLFCGSNDGILRIYNSKTGKKLKEFDAKAEIKYSFAENVSGTITTFGTMDGKCYMVNNKTLEITLCFKALFGIYSTPAWYKDILIVGSLDKRVYAYDSKKHEVVWVQETEGRIYCSPLVYKNFVYIGSNDGRLYKIALEDGEIAGFLQFSERIVNKIIIEKPMDHSTIIYVPTHTNEIYCLEDKENEQSY